ncbi:MAG: 16S rRNA (guanine(527)-N(7))-methyltransferase RsmG [Vampirovibrionales bacterium]
MNLLQSPETLAWLALLEQHHQLMPSSIQLEQCLQFYTLLEEANQRMNLTRITGWHDFLYKQLWDAWLFSDAIAEGSHVVDVGSGGGVPLIPLAILRPDCTFMGVESVKKKATFLTEVANTLALPVTLSTERIETLGHVGSPYREAADVVTSRGVAVMPVLMEYCLPLVKVGGVALAMKGPKWVEELPAATKALQYCGGEVESVLEPPEGVEPLQYSFLVVVNKVAPTGKKYPREVGMPSKVPLR